MKNAFERVEDFKEVALEIAKGYMMREVDFGFILKSKNWAMATIRMCIIHILYNEHYRREDIAIAMSKNRATTYHDVDVVDKQLSIKDRLTTDIYYRLLANDKEKLHCGH